MIKYSDNRNPLSINGFKILAVLSLLISLFPLTTSAQTEPTNESIEESIFQSSQNLHQWGAINSFHGLPSERVNAIAQTPDGFIWFGTDNGLAKFDGRRVQTDMTSTFDSVRIYDLKVDSNGTLWIASEIGVFYYRNEDFTALKETEKISINSIFIDARENQIYFVNENGSVFRLDDFSNPSPNVQIVIKKSQPFRSIAKSDKDMLIGTFNSGLHQIEGNETKSIITRPRPFFINVLKTDPDGNLWLGARSSAGNSGLFIGENLPELKILGGNLGSVNAINFDRSKNAWIGTESRGAYWFEGRDFRKRFTFENTSGGLRSNRVLATFVDREGVVWFGTDKGVSRYDSRSPRNERISDDVESNFVRTLFQSSDGFQYAGTNRGLFRFDETTNIWKPVPTFETEVVHAISQGSDDKILIGGQKGFFSFAAKPARENAQNKITEDKTRAITRFKGREYFAAFDDGIKTIEDDEEKLAFKTSAISLHNENDKALWIGTLKGVFVFDGRDAIRKPELKILDEIAIRSISGNEKSGIWFGTEKGLYLLKDGKLGSILQGTEVRDVAIRENSDGAIHVWCAASNGLYNLTLDENFGWISSQLDIEEGLSSPNVFSVLPLTNGSLLIGTNRGIVRYKTSETRPLVSPSRIVSQRVHAVGELKSGIILEYPQNTLSIDVTGLSSRTFPEQFQYSYLLFNSKNELIDKRFGSESQFVMEKLLPDDYRLEVRAFDGNLVASEPLVFNLKVEKAPFPWIATFLGVLLLIALAALIWATISQQKIFRTSKQLAHANKELNATRLNLANEAERERRRISRDLHDQTLADLRHLLLMADEISSERASDFRNEIEGVSDEIRRICEDLSPSVLENIGFAAALEWALGNAVEQVAHEEEIVHEFSCNENLDENLELNSAEQIQIYRIAQEILSNVVRHSKASNIKMFVRNSAESGFQLRIEEDGIPFDPDAVKKGRGLSNIDARAKLIKARVAWKPSNEKGMIFTLKK